ncbi:MAG: DEAD/DEAH box helicase family protein [Candidatus Pacebacteria bacterium]|nr:DEAD/DEAH box helicase family protein [Candidatus Paceibacterota bacterium]
MQLKKYQQKVLDELTAYLAEMKKYDTEKAAGVAFMIRTDKNYNWVPEIGRSPFICIKVPTGGGKTLIASHSAGIILKDYLGERSDKGLAMWFVPSDAIKTQTLNNLRDRKHPYREVLDERFSNAVKVFDLAQAKAIKKDDLMDNLCIIVSTLSAFRRTDKEWLKAYQDNGVLMPHFEELNAVDFDFLDKDKDGEIIYSLVNVIKLHNPLVIVDEGHNVQTELSFDMLKGLNPSFVLEFTATPKGQSNVLVNVSAKELKAAKMIKMPIYLANKTPWQETIYEGIEKLNDLDKRAKKIKDEYIRPIMLLQAEQDIENANRVYVEKIKNFLIQEAKIPEEQIAIQTAKKKKLPEMKKLLSKACPIRYIITVNALREGWDCPFAYVLVSVSNLGARLSVEQTIGRIMRLPNAEEKADPALNSAYIFASTQNFSQTSDMVIKGLQENGYEDIMPIASGVSVVANEYKRKIDDTKATIPFINIKDGETLRRLDYVADLIGDVEILGNQNAILDFQPVKDNRIVKIDIGNEGELIRDSAGKLGLIYHCKDFTKDDLLLWFIAKIQRGFIAIEEMSVFLKKVLDKLLTRYSFSEVARHQYQIKEAIENKVNEIVDKLTEKKFKDLSKSRLVISCGDNFDFGDSINLLQVSLYSFDKHLYEKVGKMNREELDLAGKLDALENVYWWFRNPEMSGFYIQGWKKQKFYPDFIVKTKNGNYVAVEYKGEHLAGSEDSDYKKAIGEIWQRLSVKGYYFKWVEKNNMDNVISEISKL